MSDEMKVGPPVGAVPITQDTIATYAKSTCRYCSGTGNVTRIVGKFGGTVCIEQGVVREKALCGCALKQFARKESDRVLMVDGLPYWKPEGDDAKSAP